MPSGGVDVREVLIPNYEFVDENEVADSEEIESENNDEVDEEQED